MQVDCQDFLSTSLMQVVSNCCFNASRNCSKSANITELHQVLMQLVKARSVKNLMDFEGGGGDCVDFNSQSRRKCHFQW